jgi:hypothetical protein
MVVLHLTRRPVRIARSSPDRRQWEPGAERHAVVRQEHGADQIACRLGEL